MVAVMLRGAYLPGRFRPGTRLRTRGKPGCGGSRSMKYDPRPGRTRFEEAVG
jgi:hypothetical protein